MSRNSSGVGNARNTPADTDLHAAVRAHPEAARRVADLCGGRVRDRLHRVLDDVADE